MWERRKAERHAIRTLGKIIFLKPLSVIECVVHDISEGGACLELPKPASTPDAFELIIQPDPRRPDPTRRACNVVWRSERRMGIEFR